MGQFLHKYDSLSAFTEDYNGEAYHEPWVSLVNENEHVDYNKPPFYGEGFVFDGADIRRATGNPLGITDGNITLKMLHNDLDLVVPVETDYFETLTSGSVYCYPVELHACPLNENVPSFKIKIVNADALPNSPFNESEVEITMGMPNDYSCMKIYCTTDYVFQFNLLYCSGFYSDAPQNRRWVSAFLLLYFPPEQDTQN